MSLEPKQENYNSHNMKLGVPDFGGLGVKEFKHITCGICSKKVLSSVPKKYIATKLPFDAMLKDLISGWDMANVLSVYYYLACCLIPSKKHVYAGPNSRRYIERPTKNDLHDKMKVDESPLPPNNITSCSKD